MPRSESEASESNHTCKGDWEGTGQPTRQPPWQSGEWKYQRNQKQSILLAVFFLNKSSLGTLTDLSSSLIFSLLEVPNVWKMWNQSLLTLMDSYSKRRNQQGKCWWILATKERNSFNTLCFILHDQPIMKLGACDLCIQWTKHWLTGQNKCQLGRKWQVQLCGVSPYPATEPSH